MYQGLALGTVLMFCFTFLGCFSSRNLQEQFYENNVLWCQEQTNRVTERDDPEWQNLFESCMETGQIQ